MPHIRLTSLLLLLIITVSPGTRAQGFLHVSGKQILNGKGQNVLLRGVGLGGWMLQEGYLLQVNGPGMQHTIKARIADLIGEDSTNAFYNAWLANHTRRIDIDSMKAWGFNSVRLPMHFNLYTLPVDKEPEPGKQTWLDKGFRITDSLLAWCKANQMYLILDLHAAPGGQGNDLNISDRDASKPSLWENEANRQKTIALWKKLAERYANDPFIGGYDILNEPNWGFEDLANDKNGLNEKGNQPLKQLMRDITKAIREADKNHLIIIEGNGWGNNYNGILPTWDNNMVLSFHKYWNFNTSESIKHILETRDKYNVPVWLGETGENSNVWFTEAVQLLEANNIGWAWWPLKKLGNNNPMQVHSNKDYEKVLAFWSNRGPRPTAAEAYNGMMQLANALKLENTTIKRDVLDALFRQPYSKTTIPFKANVIKTGAIVKAVDYDLGRNGVAYFDKDTADYHISNGARGGNQGRTYRNDGVDIAADPTTDSYFVNHTEAGEWLQYTLNVVKAGHYQLKLNCNPASEDAKLSFLVNKNGARKITVPKAAGWQSLEIKDIELKKGPNSLRLYIDAGDLTLGDMQFTEVK
ncbi:glycosyl hydrolase family 5 [Niastella yeongjuensis]|uniref:Glycosyl hydrolase family 5 n=1 Tax=Niastella yeongjuensis TaxID=354355 RepID=A0A1V9EYF0_9BACT|nr:cellulase family glycosylhydrolase [Niastella yeongjuensis]OQP51109.1 glycosyl hydrolase family 5 [Niastella yeongjuensis]SEN40085.1 Cellulase (glycosyl hydrolase family 5) [Niastella yeongjuensis]